MTKHQMTTHERDLLFGTQAHALSAMNVPYFPGYQSPVTAQRWHQILWARWRIQCGVKT